MKNLKQIIAVTLTATAVAATAIVSASALDTQKYDLNEDGRFDVQDVTYLQIKIAGDGELTDSQKKIADYNNDGKIDVQDVTSAQMLISGGETPTQPATQPLYSSPDIWQFAGTRQSLRCKACPHEPNIGKSHRAYIRAARYLPTPH